MKKINLYVFIQIIKSCTLVFFIFISIAWLLQISRLFTNLNNLQVDFTSILMLSTYLIPNLINITLPFIILFGLILTFIKLDKDKEIIAIYSLGISITQIRKPLFLIIIISSILYLFLNLFLSPFVYEKYKLNEHSLRNLINIEKINLSNFIELDNNLVLDFKKKGDEFTDIFISFNENGQNIVYADKGKITTTNNNFVFDLINGFKINILKNEVEKLEFENYKLDFPIKINNDYNYQDRNTYTIMHSINDKNYNHLIEKLFDTLILLIIIVFFYYNNIKKNNFTLKQIIPYLIICIFLLIMNNIIKNIGGLNIANLIIYNSLNLSIVLLYSIINSINKNA